MEQYDHFAYALDLTKKMKLFKDHVDDSFFTAPNSDSLASISARLSSINYPVLVAIDGRDSTFDYNDAESLIKKPQFFIMILQPAPTDDTNAILTAQRVCEANCLQIQARLIFDSLKYKNGLIRLELASFTFSSIGPLGENLYGEIMGFVNPNGIDKNIDPAFWNTEL